MNFVDHLFLLTEGSVEALGTQRTCSPQKTPGSILDNAQKVSIRSLDFRRRGEQAAGEKTAPKCLPPPPYP